MTCFEAHLVGGPFDGAVVETEQDGPEEIVLDDDLVYRRQGRIEGRWIFSWVQS